MLTKITTPITLFKRFKTMRRQTGMITSQRRDQREEKENEKLRGHRRHYIYALRNPRTQRKSPNSRISIQKNAEISKTFRCGKKTRKKERYDSPSSQIYTNDPRKLETDHGKTREELCMISTTNLGVREDDRENKLI